MRERRDRSKWGSSAGRSRTLAVALVVAVVVPAMALASGGSATANTGKAARTTSSAAQPVNPLGDLPISIEKFALKEHSDTYGGIVATHGATHLVVYLTRLNPRVEAEIRSRVPAGVVSFALTSHSAAYVRQVHQAVTNSAQRLAAVGTQLVQWGPDTQGGVESIGVLNLTKQDTQRLHAMFGVDNIRVYNVPLSDVPKATNVDRQNDTSPYNGGDAITNHVGGCTSGFGVTISGKTYLLTAATFTTSSGQSPEGITTIWAPNGSVTWHTEVRTAPYSTFEGAISSGLERSETRSVRLSLVGTSSSTGIKSASPVRTPARSVPPCNTTQTAFGSRTTPDSAGTGMNVASRMRRPAPAASRIRAATAADPCSASRAVASMPKESLVRRMRVQLIRSRVSTTLTNRVATTTCTSQR